jgi:hypothetical protein
MARASEQPTLEEPEKAKWQIVRDPELLAMGKIQRIIDKLPNEGAKVRVIDWLKAKIDFPLAKDVV